MDTNQKYNNPSNADIDIIRQQMDILRAKLENQEIVNERIMLSAMKRSMSWIKKYIIFELCLLPVLAILWYGLKAYIGLSWFNYFFLLAMQSHRDHAQTHGHETPARPPDGHLHASPCRLAPVDRRRVMGDALVCR